jgi:hypothetical protein
MGLSRAGRARQREAAPVLREGLDETLANLHDGRAGRRGGEALERGARVAPADAGLAEERADPVAVRGHGALARLRRPARRLAGAGPRERARAEPKRELQRDRLERVAAVRAGARRERLALAWAVSIVGAGLRLSGGRRQRHHTPLRARRSCVNSWGVSFTLSARASCLI